jgi:acid phosphatase
MSRAFALLLPLVSFALASCSLTTREPLNLTTAKSDAAGYAAKHYEEDLKTVSAKAKGWVSKRADKGGKLAIVFDIDETTLSNLPHMKEEDWGYQPVIWDQWVATAKAPAITSVREVYQTAIDKKVAVFFITGRKDSDKMATARNLKTQDMGTYSALIVKPNKVKFKSAADYKAPQRKLITEQGYTIIANVGDQQSDLDGGYAERTFKLPNPFYLIP